MSVIYSFAALAMAPNPSTSPVPVPPPAPRAALAYDFDCKLVDQGSRIFKLTGTISESPAPDKYRREATVYLDGGNEGIPSLFGKSGTVYDSYFGADIVVGEANGDFLYTFKIATPRSATGTTGVLSVSKKNFLSWTSPDEYVWSGLCSMMKSDKPK